MILRRSMWVLTAAILLLSTAHLGIAAMSARAEWSLPVLWFVGSGLALLLAGLLNIVALLSSTENAGVRGAWLLGNARWPGSSCSPGHC
jgi:hypothetical protein